MSVFTSFVTPWGSPGELLEPTGMGLARSRRCWFVGGPREPSAMARNAKLRRGKWRESFSALMSKQCDCFDQHQPEPRACKRYILCHHASAHVGWGPAFDGTSLVVIGSKCTCWTLCECCEFTYLPKGQLHMENQLKIDSTPFSNHFVSPQCASNNIQYKTNVY